MPPYIVTIFSCDGYSNMPYTLVNYSHHSAGFPGSSAGEESTSNAGDPGLIPGFGRSTGEEIGYPLQYSGLESSMAKSIGSQRVRCGWATFTLLEKIWSNSCHTHLYNVISFAIECCYISVCLVVQLCPTLCDPMMDCSPPGSSVQRVLQARILQ